MEVETFYEIQKDDEFDAWPFKAVEPCFENTILVNLHFLQAYV